MLIKRDKLKTGGMNMRSKTQLVCQEKRYFSHMLSCYAVKILLLFISLMGLTLILSCFSFLSEAKATSIAKNMISSKKIRSLKVIGVKGNGLKLEAGSKRKLKVQIWPKRSTPKMYGALKFISSNNSVAYVNNKGLITAKKNGSVRINVFSRVNPSIRRGLTVKVYSVVKRVTIDKSYYALKVGDELQLAPSVFPSVDVDSELDYKSTKPKVATVDDTGEVVAMAPGTTIVSMVAFSGAKCEVEIDVDERVTGNDMISLRETDSIFVAHRGLSEFSPENTLYAFQMAVEHGFTRIETDVRMTKDGYFVLSHNSNILDYCGVDMEVIEHDMRNLLINPIVFGNGIEQYEYVSIPFFDSFLSLCKRNKIYPQIELKDKLSYYDLNRFLWKLDEYGMRNKCQISSFVENNIYILHAIDPQLDFLFLCKGKPNKNDVKVCQTTGAAMGVRSTQLRRTIIEELLSENLKVFAWVVNDVIDVITLIRRGVSGFSCDWAQFADFA